MPEGAVSSLARRRVAAFAAALAVLSSLCASAPVSATPFDRLERAREEVAGLASQIDAQVDELATARESLAALDARIAKASRRMGRLQGVRRDVQEALARAEERYAAAQALLGATVSQAFMDAGVGSADVGVLGAVLGSSSVGELGDRVMYASAAGEAAVRLAGDAGLLRDDLAARSAALDALVSTRAAAVDELEQLRADRELAAADEAAAAAALDAARDEAVATVTRLEDRLFGATDLDLSALADALQGEHHVPYGRWAELFLGMFDAPTCRDNMVVVVAWQAAESTQAAWNPLATTHRMEGSTDFNSVGVQNFVSLEQGLLGTKETIENGWDVYRYGAIVRSLQECADAMETALAVNASSWCHGCVNGQYVLNVVPRVDADLETYLQL
jgi:hypothetical protein